jgi:ADP-heptose:LPS heptosyltransferase
MPTQHITLPANARILVVKLATIGDLLLATPALRALRETYPQARIDLLVTPASAGLLDGWEVVDNIFVLDKYVFDYPQQILTHPGNLQRLRPLWHNLRDGHYDAVILMHHLTLFFGRLPDKGFGAMHEAEYNLALAGAVGATTTDRRLFVPITDEERRQARQLVFGETEPESAARPIIAMHPGSGGYSTARRWAPERFAQLADTLYASVGGGQLLLMGGPEEAALNEQVMGMMQSGMPARNMAGKGSIRVAAAMLELADLFVGNDSGLMHLATAVGTPTVAIFGLTNSDAWGPYTGGAKERKAIVVKLDLPCMPCFYRGHDLGTPEGCATRDCLANLGVDPVAVAARRLLRESGMPSHS